MEPSPVLFLIFNRPEKTQLVFGQIKKAKPSKLYIAADGPRSSEEVSICHQARSIVMDGIDWPCEVHTLFRESNLGCTPAVVSAISWFFDHENEGIILEDDCFPDLSFFEYCTDLLKKYSDEPSVMHISGSNFMFGEKVTEYSYFFTQISICWGWATWKRAWSQYSLDRVEIISNEDYLKTLKNPGFDTYYFDYWKRAFDYHRSGSDNIWDYRWLFTLWHFNGLAISPSKNLVKNIGYGADATTSKGHNKTRNKLASLETYNILPLRHSTEIKLNRPAENKLNAVFSPKPTVSQLMIRKLSSVVPASVKSRLRKFL